MMETYIYDTMPAYIRSNAGFYDRIAEEFYEETAKARTKEEYDLAFAKICRCWMKDLTNEDVQRYLLESGIMEAEDMAAIRKFYIDNAGDFQKAILSANMQEGKKYTLVYLNDFGFPVLDKITFYGCSPCQYAQYTDAVKMIFKRARKRTMMGKYFYGTSLAIYEGWYDISKEDTYKKTGESSTVTTYISKYTCFDSRYFSDMVEKLGTPLVEYRNFRVREADGKVFA